ncbi:MAG: zinc-binding protein [Clostridium sp.]|uniref:zinc-binding protein n=1 Tax=Clostridium sp. TaxID=1506 RepID=UPI001EC320B3|nr:zinc-binding protein [Clostridium sp.]MBS5886289.1 zinc-binding protein [Clostridium sp.]MDU7148320.1 zinc-binding protein [Clostridium sp.]
MDVQKEYERIKALFDGADESQLSLIDGTLWEAARIRVELNSLHEIVKQSGLIKVHPQNPGLQKELPVSKLIVKARANYLNYISKLASLLGKNIDDEDEDLSDYE